MPSIKYTLTRGDDEFEIEVCYEVAPFDPGNSCGPPEACDPPSGGEVTELSAWTEAGEIDLTTDEIEKIEQHIYATHDYND